MHFAMALGTKLLRYLLVTVLSILSLLLRLKFCQDEGQSDRRKPYRPVQTRSEDLGNILCRTSTSPTSGQRCEPEVDAQAPGRNVPRDGLSHQGDIEQTLCPSHPVTHITLANRTFFGRFPSSYLGVNSITIRASANYEGGKCHAVVYCTSHSAIQPSQCGAKA